KGGLRLDSRTGARKGGETGPAIVPGKPADSLIGQALRHENGYEMPPKKPKLAEAVIADFVKWIELGAPDPRDEAAPLAESWPPEARAHWAFQPIKAATSGRRESRTDSPRSVRQHIGLDVASSNTLTTGQGF